ncbi:MAG: hypothetical protein ACU0BF_06100 [Paracoccaceae bacterium]
MKAILTLILAVAFAAAPLITSPFSGFTEDQLPIPQVDPPVQPAGYAFAIWGLIYAWLIVSAGFGVWTRRDDPEWERGRTPLIVSLGVGVPWLAIANASAIWATVTILIMAAGAIAAVVMGPARDRWLFAAPVGIYAGWLTAASGVSVASVMAGYGIGPAQLGWAYIAIALALAVAATVQVTLRRAPGYGLTVCWALVAIVVTNWAQHWGLVALSAAGIAIMATLAVRAERRGRLAT